MNSSSFELLQQEKIQALNLVVESYRHRGTGARHFHLRAEDPNNVFLVAFLTMPEDSTGVAHILEHTVLCGSERYPVRDPFFLMLRRSLSTFMNAFTSSDWTAYPFGSQSRKDFDNLLNVYLDAAFFPLLQEPDFSQEGSRVEFSDPADPTTPLVFKGVVFNEMKGAMSSPSRALWETISRPLFPTTTYHFNSGGDPEVIPDLTWEQLKGFHAKHYHPSNAVFMTYGDIPAVEHQAKFEERVLGRFERLNAEFSVPDEQRLREPVRVTGSYAVEDPKEIKEKTHITLSWLLGKSISLESLLEGYLLTGVLLDHSASPLMQVLETTDLGTSPSSNCGLDDSSREMVFTCGLEGSEPERADAVEQLVMDLLAKVVEEGVPQEQVEAVLHQLELSRREIGGDGIPYGLQLMLTMLPAALHRGDPVQILDLDPVLEKLRQEIQDPNYIKQLVRRLLLDNPHRVRVVLAPDAELTGQRQAREAERLAQLAATLDEDARNQVVERAAALKARQEGPDQADLLPRLEPQDIPPDMFIPEGVEREVAGLPITWYDRPTNGLFYQQLVIDLPELEPELLELLPLLSNCLTEVGSGGRDYLTTQAWQAAVTGSLSARASTRSAVQDVQSMRGIFTLTGKSLVRNHHHLSQLLEETFSTARFDELTRLRELVAQIRAGAEIKITDQGHLLAISTAAGGMAPSSALADRWGGLPGVKRLRVVDQSLNEEAGRQAFARRLEQLREALQQAPRQMVVIGEATHFDRFAEGIAAAWKVRGIPPGARSPLVLAPIRQRVRQGWLTSTQVHFCAKAFPAVPYVHEDAPLLSVLAQFIKNGFLHRTIREQGGAYGAIAGYDSDAGSFHMASYRDPRLEETLADFDRSCRWMLETPHEQRVLEEAILGVISGIDRPGSPAGEARQAFHATLHGRTPERRRNYRQRVLQATLADLRRVAEKYLQPEVASVGVVTSPTAEGILGGLGLEVQRLTEE